MDSALNSGRRRFCNGGRTRARGEREGEGFKWETNRIIRGCLAVGSKNRIKSCFSFNLAPASPRGRERKARSRFESAIFRQLIPLYSELIGNLRETGLVVAIVLYMSMRRRLFLGADTAARINNNPPSSPPWRRYRSNKSPRIVSCRLKITSADDQSIVCPG